MLTRQRLTQTTTEQFNRTTTNEHQFSLDIGERENIMSKNKTRTKDKYRVVYNDNQRIELENEFRLNEYIAIPRKQEIAQKLQLSERQIKIWFQNRRAKKRKQQKRRQVTTTSAKTTSAVSPSSVAAPTPTLSSGDLAAQVAAQSTAPVGAYIATPTTEACRKSSPTAALGLIKGSGMISPSSANHHHHHHHHHNPNHHPHKHHQHLQDIYQEPTAAIMGAASAGHHHLPQHHHHHTHQQQQQQIYQQHQHHNLHHQQHPQHGRLAEPNHTSNNYYNSNYQDQCHQDYYNNIIHPSHRAANIEPFQQPSPATAAAIGTTTVTGAGGLGASHQGAAYQSAQSSWPNLSQSTSPQIATSPAININQHQFHSGTHQTPPNSNPHPLPTAPVSPYHAATSHANATYTNGYPLLTQHQQQQQLQLQQHQQQQQQQQHQHQHYIPHHHPHLHHQQQQQQQPSHHQAIMQV